MCPLKNHIILEINTSDVTMTKYQQVNLFKTRHELVPVRDEGLKTGRKMGERRGCRKRKACQDGSARNDDDICLGPSTGCPTQ